ncbi:unnamed protein product [Paramecium sonneborni]|uniref:Uncharacterized protein n=1 Tax=Paramecium sonneborni TaxID=65129 RepID=A0A8S1KMU9_9CILI|nr:unnamed protein product [Paramecium sonneborni]
MINQTNISYFKKNVSKQKQFYSNILDRIICKIILRNRNKNYSSNNLNNCKIKIDQKVKSRIVLYQLVVGILNQEDNQLHQK